MARIPGRPKLPRRAILRWMAAAPAAVVVHRATLAQTQGDSVFNELDKLSEPDDAEAAKKAAEGLSDAARCIAENEEGLSRKERRALMEKMPGLEGALKKLREFEIADDVEPAFRFQAMRSGRRRS